MVFLNRDQILSAQDLKTEPVDCPEWGGKVLIREGSSTERDAFDLSIMEGKGKDREVNLTHLRAKLLALACVDESGERLFSENDVEAIDGKNSKVIQRLFKVAQRMWALNAQDVEDLVGESKPGLNAGLGIDTPANVVELSENSNGN